MKPYLTAEQLELRREVRRMLHARLPLARTRELMLGNREYPEDVWQVVVGEMALLGLAVDEAYGGMGPAYVEIALVAEELGYLCAGVPFIASALAAFALQTGAGCAVAQELLPLLATGERRAAVCLPPTGSSQSLAAEAPGVATADLEPSVDRGADTRWSVTGSWRAVLDAEGADFLVVAAATGPELGLFVVDTTAGGVTVQPLAMLDETRRFAEVTLTGASGRRVAAPAEDEGASAGSPVEEVLDVAAVLIAADSLGGARACLDMAVQYAKDREQFGRPIGSFQAIKFRCADMLVRVEAATSAVFYASRLIASPDHGELTVVGPLAKSYCTEAYFDVAADTIQVHGGIGFTWEHDVHLYFKRATCSRQLWGDPQTHRSRMLEAAGVA